MEKNSTKANKDLRKNARALYKAGLVTKEEKKKLKKPGTEVKTTESNIMDKSLGKNTPSPLIKYGCAYNSKKSSLKRSVESQKALFNLTPEGDSIRKVQKTNLENNPDLKNKLDSLVNVRKNLPAKDLFGPKEEKLTKEIRATYNLINKKK
tara:strand:+ start:58 stop:510 length:453 start_codon:yes stop_codon:yes gene_type:complete